MTRDFKTITSTQNPIYRDWLKLHKSAGIEKLGKLFIMGEKIVHDYLAMHGNKNALEFVSAEGMPTAIAEKYKLAGFTVPATLFNELDILNTRSPLLVIQKPKIPKWDVEAAASEIEILLPFQDPNNVGAVIRTATAFGARKIILLTESASPFHPRAVRASAGTVFQAPLFVGPSIQELSHIESVVSLDLNGENLDQFRWSQHTRLLIGEEGQGVPKSIDAQKVKIPISKNCESLNATVAASLALYSYRMKFPL